MSARGTIVGIDLGGTNVRAAAFDLDGTLRHHAQIPIEATRGPEVGLTRIQALIASVLNATQSDSLMGIGIGSTGPLDREQGKIQNPYTLPTWEDVSIVSYLSNAFSVPVVLENDADAAALGEYWQGAARGVSRLLALTIGTGVGTAVILDGHIYRGWRGLHGEGGHHVVDPAGPLCYCGARGCMEILVAGPSIAKLAQKLAAQNPQSLLSQRAGGRLDTIDALTVANAAREGDALAHALMEQTAAYIAVGLLNMISFFVPEMIVLSGSIMKDYDLFEPTIRRYLAQCSLMVPAFEVKIVMARLGDQAGVYGAAYASLREIKQTTGASC